MTVVINSFTMSESAYAGTVTRLPGAVILVVGASGGLGSRIADQLETQGATVVRSSRRGGADLRSSPAVLDPLRGQLDGLVIAAGVVAFGPAAEVTDGTLDELFEVNALAPIRLIRDAIPLLSESAKAGRDPFVVTFSGIVSEAPTAGLASYSAAKAALAAFVTAAARELRHAGIRMLDARLGHTETELSRHPIAGAAPAMPQGHDPDAVAARIVQAIVEDERELPSSAFRGQR